MPEHLVQGLAVASAMIAAISAFLAYLSYRRNTDTKRAEFLMQLHRAFFVEKTYWEMRDILDSDEETAKTELSQTIQEESPEFTDFPNFFELVAYFEHCGTLRAQDVLGLLKYYLHLLKANPEIRGYVAKKSKSFEHLHGLLNSLD